MSGSEPTFDYRRYLAPKYWPTWVGLGLLWLASRIPYKWLMRLGALLGHIGYSLMPERRRIIRANLRACFPDYSEQQLRRLGRQSFCASTLALFESALSWWASDKTLQQLYRVEGMDNLDAAVAREKGVLILGAHYTTLEMSNRLASFHLKNTIPTYKRAHNALFEAIMTGIRNKLTKKTIRSSDMRGVIRSIKEKNIVWYAPDQDFGTHSSVFAPFMGVLASTLTLTARIAKITGAPVVPYYSERLPNYQGYVIRFGKALQDFPTNDDVADATTVNAAIEKQVRRTPEQYLWGHRRFKTRPHGEPQFYKPRRDTHLKKYSLLLALLALPVAAYSLWMALRHKDSRYFSERLGFGKFSRGPYDLWLHAASIGELNAILPLITLIQERHPNLSMLVTLNTPTGMATARKKLPAGIPCHYMPVDWQFAVERFFRIVQPKSVIITETEIWPNLNLHCYHVGIPLVIVNGRLGKKVLAASYWVKRVMCRALEEVYWILSRSEEDRERFITMGANSQYVEVIGNIKFSQLTRQRQDAALDLSRPFVLAASTRDGEEKIIADCWQKLSPANYLLVIVPRHPKRLGQIIHDLKPLNVDIAIRSKQQTPGADTQVYIADTFGELTNFIAAAEFVIMGGSLLPHGGQNIIEVGQAGKAVLFGPHMHNFNNEAALFNEHNAGIQFKDESDLCSNMATLLSEPELAESMGKNALALTNQFSNTAEKYLDRLEQILDVFNGK